MIGRTKIFNLPNEYSCFIPAENRFLSSKGGKGFAETSDRLVKIKQVIFGNARLKYEAYI